LPRGRLSSDVSGDPPGADALFVAAWPGIAARLARELARTRRLDWHSCEEILQEVAERVVSRAEAFPSADDLYRWSRSVAYNLASNVLRTRRHLSEVPPPERPSSTDVPREVEGRLVLATVLRHLSAMSAPDRAAVLGRLGGDGPGAVAGRVRVRRHRARERLRALVDGAAAFVGLRLRLAIGDPGVGAASALAVALVVPAVVGLLVFVPVEPASTSGPSLRGNAADSRRDGGRLDSTTRSLATAHARGDGAPGGTSAPPGRVADLGLATRNVVVALAPSIDQAPSTEAEQDYETRPLEAMADVDGDGEPDVTAEPSWDATCVRDGERGPVAALACPLLADVSTR
jgi:DNA-directed RNA polymerase specialized sigma24 family protein